MRPVGTRLSRNGARAGLASWENEGGAISTAPTAAQDLVATLRWSPVSIIDAAPALHRVDQGKMDTNSLTILRISLLLIVPALGGIAIFWGAAVPGSP